MKKVICLILLICLAILTINCISYNALNSDNKYKLSVKYKYSVDDIKMAFEKQNDGFIYYFDGINDETQRFMVSTDGEGHAAVYHYEIDLTNGDVYNGKNEVIDNLDKIQKTVNNN